MIRDELPARDRRTVAVYAKDYRSEIRDEVWRLFRDAVQPLHESGKLGAILLQFAPWILPAKHTPAMLERARQRLRDLPDRGRVSSSELAGAEAARAGVGAARAITA